MAARYGIRGRGDRSEAGFRYSVLFDLAVSVAVVRLRLLVVFPKLSTQPAEPLSYLLKWKEDMPGIFGLKMAAGLTFSLTDRFVRRKFRCVVRNN